MRPTFRNLDESFEGWAYRSGLLRRIAFLEKERFLERQGKNDRIYRLTTEGRLRALGGRDPETEWSRRWDRRWRLVCFDVPTSKNLHRRRLRHYLRSRRFGLLQRSIWITPHPLQDEIRLIHSAKPNVESLVLLQARTCGGESDADIVARAWDFDRINKLYARHLSILEQKPSRRVHKPAEAGALVNWTRAEHDAWTKAVTPDPLLPKWILPAGYLGQRAWRRRIEVLAAAARDIRSFKP